MNITRDVIADLYPVYQSGEASPETRALVEEFLSNDPEFARRLQDSTHAALLAAAHAPLPREHQIETLRRTRELVRRRSWFLALGIFFTALPFSAVFAGGRFTFVLWRDAPAVAAIGWLAAVVCWLAFVRGSHRLRHSGLVGSRRALRRALKTGGQV